MKESKWNCTANFISEQLKELEKLRDEERIKLCKLLLGEELYEKILNEYKDRSKK